RPARSRWPASPRRSRQATPRPRRSRVLPRARLLIRLAAALDGARERLAAFLDDLPAPLGGGGRLLAAFARPLAQILARLASRGGRVEQRDRRSADRPQQERQHHASGS